MSSSGGKYRNLSLFLAAGSVAISIPLLVYFYTQYRSQERSSSSQESTPGRTSNQSGQPTDGIAERKNSSQKRSVRIVYATVTGTARKFAESLHGKLTRSKKSLSRYYDITWTDIKEFNEEKLHEEDIILFVLSTWSEGSPVESSRRFFDWLNDVAYDFRWDKNHLERVSYSVFGLGGAVYGEYFCKSTIEVDRMLEALSGVRVVPLGLGDSESNLEKKYQKWCQAVESWLISQVEDYTPDITPKVTLQEAPKETIKEVIKESSSCGCGERSTDDCCKNDSNTGTAAHSSCGHNETTDDTDTCTVNEEEEEDRVNRMFIDEDDSDEEDRQASRINFKGIEDDEPVDGSVIDMEDIGRSKASEELKKSLQSGGPPREMVTKLQRKALTKEGYRIIGSHSAVKLCRWTKNQMRGRGGCYKHTFYGITSYQCMEATPSLACANKCVFCWRHHKNPVGTEWRWKEDEPIQIVQEAISLHQGMINEMKGVPGVLPERLNEAMTVRHCALSLVGEPIMYPRINEMLKELHMRGISSFLVTNAQFPDRIKQLDPVTQLYVSVDAASKDSLKAIDRPLFKDFWERFMSSLKAMKEKEQRTVYRLTLVKSWNMNEIEEYASLIELGQPDFIEIKAVTYCGKSDASSLTMKNVPWHTEVCEFAEAIANRLQERKLSVKYSIATEHEHSCCILLAREDKFLVDGVWHTWINYDKFEELIMDYYNSHESKTFTSVDYMAPTPSWAIYKSEAKGFDPVEKRWKRNKATGEISEIPYQPSESGCG